MINLCEFLRIRGYAARQLNDGRVVVKVAPATAIGTAGRLLLLLADELGVVADIRAVYDPLNKRAEVWLDVPSSAHP